MLYLDDSVVDTHLSREDAINCVAEAFRLLATGAAINTPRHRTAAGETVLNVMWALAPTKNVVGVKSYPVVGSHTTRGAELTLVLSRYDTGESLAVLQADRLGQLRTGAASALATTLLARPDSTTLAIIGTGFQATAQIQALSDAMPTLDTVLIAGRTPGRAQSFAAQLEHTLKLDIRTCAPEVAVASADIITTATTSAEPVVPHAYVKPGTHLNLVGSNRADKREVARALLDKAALIATDDVATASVDGGGGGTSF